MTRALALVLALAASCACSRPEKLCPEPPAPPPCVCEPCPACPEAAPPQAEAAPLPSEVPAHLRPSEAQCRAACERLTQVEARRMLNRASEADPEIAEALAKGLEEERRLLMDGCVARCQKEFTAAVAVCVRKHGDPEAVLSCVAKSAGM